VSETPRYSSLRDYLRVLREQWIVIAVIAIVAGAAAFAMSIREDPVYDASASVAFQDETQQLSAVGGSVSPNVPVARTPQARAQTVDEPQVIRRLQKSLPEELSVEQLAGAVSTTLDEESFLVDVNASWSEAAFAATLANEFAEQAVDYTNQTTRDDYRDAQKEIERQIDDLDAQDLTDQAERAALIGQLTNIRFLAENAEPARIAEVAQPPSSPTSPKTVRNTALGLLLGLIIGIVVAFVRDTLDRRLRGARDVHDQLGYPVLGHVREDSMGRKLRSENGYDPQLQTDLESFRIIRQNLQFLSSGDTPRRTTLVTSPLPAEGKSTVAASLAIASAAAGKATLLVEADLRRPELANRLGVQTAPGLTDYLVGQAEPRDILQICPPATGGGAAPQANGDGGTDGPPPPTPAKPLVFIAAGTQSPHPAELLGSERLRAFLDQVSEAYEMVVIDTSPLLPVADTLELLPHVDNVLLCVRSGQTTRDQASAARAALEHFPDRPTGLVITGLRKRDEPEYSYYSYGYTSGVGA
jgi:succinoglycan biosynthesis transport protein ExoP